LLTNKVDKFTGRDFKASAAFLYNITGNTAYETMLNSLSTAQYYTTIHNNIKTNCMPLQDICLPKTSQLPYAIQQHESIAYK
jgi:hypothetical protein